MSKQSPQDTLFNPAHTEEAAQLRDDLKTVHAELTRLNDRYMILLKDRGAWERSVRAAAGKASWEQVAHTYRWYLVGEVKQPLSSICGRIRMLPEHPSADQIRQLKWAAEDVHKLLSEHDNETTPLLAENRRLHDAVQEQAKRLHERYGYEADRSALSATGRCECPGCELVRSINDAETEAA